MILEAPSLKKGMTLHYNICTPPKVMDREPPGPLITSAVELKLDSNTMFEWKKHSHKSTTIPHYKLLDFLNLRAQASELLPPSKKPNHTSNIHFMCVRASSYYHMIERSA